MELKRKYLDNETIRRETLGDNKGGHTRRPQASHIVPNSAPSVEEKINEISHPSPLIAFTTLEPDWW